MSEFDVPLELRLPLRTANALKNAGIDTVGELLMLAPRRYYKWGTLTSLRSLRVGEEVTILAEVVSKKILVNRSGRGVRMEVQLTDGSSSISATFFGKNHYSLAAHESILREGANLLFAGKVGEYRGHLQLVHPSFEGVEDPEESVQATIDKPIPIYPTQKGVTSWVIQRAISMVLEAADEANFPEFLDEEIRERNHLLTTAQAMRKLHQPHTEEDYRLAKRSLAWGEAFVLQSALAVSRHGWDALRAPVCLTQNNDVLRDFNARLPFELTESQKRAITQISRDLEQEKPMQRLLQADVGAGKTIVALSALCQVVGAGYQGAFIAPTEVLAQQHFSSMSRLIGPIADVRLLTGSTPVAARREIVSLLAQGQPLMVVGTHALLQDSVDFVNLGLVVIDEQHRFGVAQRDKLRESQGEGRGVHQLVMTATPIPRTIAMTVFGDLDETRMVGLPPGRSAVETYLVDACNSSWVERLWQRAREEIDSGGRVYVVAPRIDEDDDVRDADVDAGENERPPLASVAGLGDALSHLSVFEGISIAQLTGKTPPEVKSQTMEDFASGAQPLLVATTVIEVGVDVPQASMMVIMDAQQFGLSTLHQLRGRVGRSQRRSVCMAVHRHELTTVGHARLEAFAGTTNGFELAEADMKLRSEGDVLGATQSGRRSHLNFLSVRRDAKIIEEAREEAERIVLSDPMLEGHPDLSREIWRRSGENLEWLERS